MKEENCATGCRVQGGLEESGERCDQTMLVGKIYQDNKWMMFFIDSDRNALGNLPKKRMNV